MYKLWHVLGLPLLFLLFYHDHWDPPLSASRVHAFSTQYYSRLGYPRFQGYPCINSHDHPLATCAGRTCHQNHQLVSTTYLCGTTKPITSTLDEEFDESWKTVDEDDEDDIINYDEDDEDYSPQEESIILRDLSYQVAQTQHLLQIQQQQIQQILQLLTPGGTSPVPPLMNTTATTTFHNGAGAAATTSVPLLSDGWKPTSSTITTTSTSNEPTQSAFTSATTSSVVPLRVMVFIDGTWLYYSLFERGFACPIARRYGAVWYTQYRVDWEALPGVIARVLQDAGWRMNSNTNNDDVSNHQANGRRPLEITRMCVFTSMKAGTAENSPRGQLYRDMRNAGYDVHQLETIGMNEKCVDIQLAVEMLHFATVPHSYDIAVLLSGDKDFMPALARVRQKGRQVAIVSMKTGCNRALYDTDGVKDFDMIWLEDHLEELIVPKVSLSAVNGERKFAQANDDAPAIHSFVIVRVIADFIENSEFDFVSSRDVGRYLKSLQVGTGVESRTLLEEIKSRHIGLRPFLRREQLFALRDGPARSYLIGLAADQSRLNQKQIEADLSVEDLKLLRRLQMSIPTDKQTAYFFTREAHNANSPVAPGSPREFVPDVEVINLPEDLTTDYTTWTVAQLKERCRERGLPTSGLKATLLERVQEDVKAQVNEYKTKTAEVTVPTRVRHFDEITNYLLDLVKEYLHACGGKASSRDVGRYLAANRRKFEGHSVAVSANQELKKLYGGLKHFVAAHEDVFTADMNFGQDPSEQYAFLLSLKKPESVRNVN